MLPLLPPAAYEALEEWKKLYSTYETNYAALRSGMEAEGSSWSDQGQLISDLFAGGNGQLSQSQWDRIGRALVGIWGWDKPGTDGQKVYSALKATFLSGGLVKNQRFVARFNSEAIAWGVALRGTPSAIVLGDFWFNRQRADNHRSNILAHEGFHLQGYNDPQTYQLACQVT